MEQKEPIIVLYDREEEYARLFSEYLKRQKELPWEIHTYTGIEELLDSEKTGEVTMLVVAESSYADRLEMLQPVCQAILNESGTLRWHQFPNINKYQEAEGVWKELLELYVEAVGVRLPLLCAEYKTKFIGIYSPVHRCLQSSFALTLAQLIAEKHPALYLNFEHYVGIPELLPDMQTFDMADLLYFLNAEKEKFRLRMQTMLKHVGNLDYVPPMKSGQNLLTVTAEEWMNLLQKIEDLGEYEYVVLDLTESMQGLFEILRMCKKVFTVTREDRIAKSKLLQYEQLLALYDYDDVLEKTERLSPPHIQRLPEDIEQLTRGELAALAKNMLKGV